MEKYISKMVVAFSIQHFTLSRMYMEYLMKALPPTVGTAVADHGSLMIGKRDVMTRIACENRQATLAQITPVD